MGTALQILNALGSLSALSLGIAYATNIFRGRRERKLVERAMAKARDDFRSALERAHAATLTCDCPACVSDRVTAKAQAN